eukprot:CAMPEP_0178443826 /NCGR_PEP_ID=MMETSP0689_2-20121128/39126_1 /TAXON_ID=160604 /ORGANISM="Amphidinium massartii, Strain CS-259" /LENGTH=101 /DNA_ID=CAMNT_0020067907 /DNA_START=30 /DNA_END=332 /DNA_ORIENTATION=-
MLVLRLETLCFLAGPMPVQQRLVAPRVPCLASENQEANPSQPPQSAEPSVDERRQMVREAMKRGDLKGILDGFGLPWWSLLALEVAINVGEVILVVFVLRF